MTRTIGPRSGPRSGSGSGSWSSTPPPYYALLGAINAEIMHPNAAHAAAGQFPTHADLPRLRVRQFALDRRPTRGGWWHINGVFDSPAGNIWYRVDRDTETVAADFMARLVDYLAAHVPAGQVAGPGVEAGLARCCWVLAGWENSYRGGHLTPSDDDLYHGINPLTVDAMRASATEAAVTELVALARRLTEHRGLAQLRDLAGDPPTGQPLGIAGPVLVPSWADADLLVGDCLVEVKT